MCHMSCIVFGVRNLFREEIENKRIIEVGSKDVNGSLRPFLETMHPREYIGVDIETGPGVDIICQAEDLLAKFGKESFDVVVSTELLEHVRNWRGIISNIKHICRTGGIILITTRSLGFPYHGYPYDFWRYEKQDLLEIFSDFTIEKIEKDKSAPGIFLKVKKPSRFNEKDLSNLSLYSIIEGKRVLTVSEEKLKRYQRKLKVFFFVRKKFFNFIGNLSQILFGKIFR